MKLLEFAKSTIKRLILKILSYYPTRLPVGKTEMDKFVTDVIALSGEYANRTSMEFAIASMIIHAPADRGALPKNYFVVRLRKSAANQVASQVFQDIKTAQDAQTKTVEDTSAQKVADGKPS